MKSTARTPMKRICLLSDGTWSDPESEIPTNILRLANAILPASSDGIAQTVFYDAGIGTTGSAFSRVSGGAVGKGIDRNILDLYTFLGVNYNEGDEIYLFGYSRGAYTVRSLAGLIFTSGLVRRGHLDFAREAYDLYRSSSSAESAEAAGFRELHGGRVPIKLLTCFDTVGALGLPFNPPFPLSLVFNVRRYQFHNTKINPDIENAIHCLSVDEERRSFSPTLMIPAPRRPGQLTQLYLPGGHGGVGGGAEGEEGLARNALRFVVDEMRRRGLGLSVNMAKVPPGDVTNPPKRVRLFSAYRLLLIVGGGRAARRIKGLDELHESVFKRYAEVPQWRPSALVPLREQILHKLSSS